MKNLEQDLIERARKLNKTIILPEAEFCHRVAKAGCIAKEFAKIVMVGDEEVIKKENPDCDFDGIKFVSAKTVDMDKLSDILYEARKNKGMTKELAIEEITNNPVMLATMLLKVGEVDGLVSGAKTSTANTLKPGLQVIKSKPGINTISSCFIFYDGYNKDIGDDGVMIFADCGLNINPTAEQLVDIVASTVDTAKDIVNMDPRIAMLSYSTMGSAKGEVPDKMNKAKELILEKYPDLLIDGEYQVDAAIRPEVAKTKAPNGKLNGNANILIFPDLQSGNIGYKLFQNAGKSKSIGPIMQGFNKPINDLSRGAKVDEIVVCIALTALQK